MRSISIFAAGAIFAAVAVHADDNLDGIVRVVNNSIITKLQVEDAIADQVNSLRRVVRDPTEFYNRVKALQENQLEALERSKLIMDDFTRGEYTTNWVDDEVNKLLKQDLQKRFSGSETMLTLTLQAEGRTKEEYRKELREQVIVDELAHYHSTGKVIISPAAIEKYYNDHLDDFKVENQVKLRTICLVPAADDPPGAVKELAAEIMRKMDSGVPFADMAKVYSADQYHSAGGDWGRWVERKEMIAPLADVAFSLKPGQRGPVVEVQDERSRTAPLSVLPHGPGQPAAEVPDERARATVCYLLMVDDARPAHITPLAEVQGAIDQVLKGQRGKVLLDQWIKRLQAKSHVESF
jgi:parvulin-like peptidyl-prolyl isomerase